ncbi:hypothetical protein PCANC_16178 [Puccinia coronata f. sp. avenae]|uniref:DUF4219 domain-containing protein n=1 Tax=Puccinia coronata f. sp. avenae TaxID=200324 RepID=A0A2N5SZA6_9BASI|nr:hypothetical protein PCANC_16178 [Puccinia coronata f. sp. avenae]
MSDCKPNCQNNRPPPQPPPASPTSAPAKSNKDYFKFPQFTRDNYLIWQSKIQSFLKVKKLIKCVQEPIPKDAPESVLDQYMEAACIIGGHVTDEVYNHKNIDNPHTTWHKLNKKYTSTLALEIYQAWCKWEDVWYNHNMYRYITGMKAVLAKFAAMGLDMLPKILSCAIIGKITQKHPALTSFFVGASVSTMLVKKVHSPNRRPVEEHAV